jgi:hypothetical protein
MQANGESGPSEILGRDWVVLRQGLFHCEAFAQRAKVSRYSDVAPKLKTLNFRFLEKLKNRIFLVSILCRAKDG